MRGEVVEEVEAVDAVTRSCRSSGVRRRRALHGCLHAQEAHIARRPDQRSRPVDPVEDQAELLALGVRAVQREPAPRTLSTNCGSFERKNLSVRSGRRPKARQIRPTALDDSSSCFASMRELQWVLALGCSCNVASTTRSTSSSVTDRGRPTRGSSQSPSRRKSTKRWRHLPTVGCDKPRFSATSMLFAPSAQASTILARSTRADTAVRLRVSCSNSARSPPVSTSFTFGRPIVLMRPASRRSENPREVTKRTWESHH